MMDYLTFDDILLVPQISTLKSRSDVDTSVKMGPFNFKIPIISSNMDTITGYKMAVSMYHLGGLGILHRFNSIKENVEEFLRVKKHNAIAGVSLGVNEGLERAKALWDVGAQIFCIDVAHGHSYHVFRLVESLKNQFPASYIIAGNVVTPEAVKDLKSSGSDAVKIGIGPGSVCSTRQKTGFGFPQFSAISQCSNLGIFTIADGGCKYPADIVKSLYAGGGMVMLGGMLAGTDETPGEVINRYLVPGDTCKIFRGMASREAQEDFMGGMAGWKTSEGISIQVPCKGPVANVIADIVGGLRSGLTYAGAHNINELRSKGRHIVITPSTYLEGTPHGANRL